MLLDLDPVEVSYDGIVEAALLVHDLLSELGLRGYPKTTGGDGMHIYVPLEPIYTFEQVRSFAELLSHLVVDREPKLFTTPRSVNKREKGRVYFDYLQIGSGKTIAAPYVLRAYDGAPVATPLDWKEVKRGLRPTDFRIDNTIERFNQFGDIFAPVLKGGQRIEDVLRRLQDDLPETRTNCGCVIEGFAGRKAGQAHALNRKRKRNSQAAPLMTGGYLRPCGNMRWNASASPSLKPVRPACRVAVIRNSSSIKLSSTVPLMLAKAHRPIHPQCCQPTR